MSETKLVRFQCDECGEEFEKAPEFGPPPDWKSAEGADFCSWLCLIAWAQRQATWEAKAERESRAAIRFKAMDSSEMGRGC